MLEQKLDPAMMERSTPTMAFNPPNDDNHPQWDATAMGDQSHHGHEPGMLDQADQAVDRVIDRLERLLGFVERVDLQNEPSIPVMPAAAALQTMADSQTTEKVHPQARSYGLDAVKRRAYDEAIDALGHVWHKGGDRDGELALNLGFALLKKGRMEEAARVLSIPFQKQPEDPALATLLGKALLFQSRYEDAAKVMVPAALKHDSRFNLHFYLGLAFAKLERFADAQRAWQIAAKIRPEDRDTQGFLEKVEMELAAD
ncbi:tetratricopeptide repeat protein [Magnetococcus sp. PR-3]|uniref:tetratricopeptide repeat protein n=1 Tax=Magnetococcus sp. PR-3 TaxID=3120355 RepID=UPI002FCE0E62